LVFCRHGGGKKFFATVRREDLRKNFLREIFLPAFLLAPSRASKKCSRASKKCWQR
jgi:hypothetical protein